MPVDGAESRHRSRSGSPHRHRCIGRRGTGPIPRRMLSRRRAALSGRLDLTPCRGESGLALSSRLPSGSSDCSSDARSPCRKRLKELRGTRAGSHSSEVSDTFRATRARAAARPTRLLRERCPRSGAGPAPGHVGIGSARRLSPGGRVRQPRQRGQLATDPLDVVVGLRPRTRAAPSGPTAWAGH